MTIFNRYLVTSLINSMLLKQIETALLKQMSATKNA